MNTFQRPQVNTLCQRLAEVPRRIITLFGPRQTGKTAIVKQALLPFDPDLYWPLAVDDPNPSEPYLASEVAETTSRPQVKDAHWLVQYWEAARREAERLGKFVLVFDEIQKIPQWSETVKGLWDADRARNCPLHVVILGSAPLLIAVFAWTYGMPTIGKSAPLIRCRSRPDTRTKTAICRRD